jgi:hypothetical protein
MTIAEQIYESLNESPFSYGETVAKIIENRGKSFSALPEEDFVVPDNSVLRVTNSNLKVLTLLEE